MNKRGGKLGRGLKVSVCAGVWLVMAVSQSLAQLNFPGGRIAISHDGNNYDLDDYVAAPMNLALLEATGMKSTLVHFDYCSHLANKDAQYAEMLESVNGAVDRFNIDSSIVFDDQTELDAAIANFKAEAEKSSASNPLWFLCAGPMEVPWRCVNAVDPQYRQYINCVSHSSSFNEGHTYPSVGMIHDWDDLGALGVNQIRIQNQNGTEWNTAKSNVYWMRDSDNPDLQWLYNRNAKSTYDSSDTGMTWWLLTGGLNGGDEDGGWQDYKPYLEALGESGGSDVTVQAEDYSSQSGIVNEGTHVGYVNHNDWIRFNGIDLASGSQTVSIRYSSKNTACTASLETTTGTVLATIDLPKSGGWTTWSTVTETVSFSASAANLVVKFKHPTSNTSVFLCNVDWLSFSGSTGGPAPVVIFRKANAQGYAIDGNWNGTEGQNVYLYSYSAGNVNQQFEEIDRGDGYYSYQKVGTSVSLDGGSGGGNTQNVYLGATDSSEFDQQWKKVDMGNGYFQLQKRNALGYAINGGSGGANAQNVNLYNSSVGSLNLQWMIEYQ